jgi:hypothetical protein
MDFGKVLKTETTLVTSNVPDQYNLITFLSRASRNQKGKNQKNRFFIFSLKALPNLNLEGH